MLKKITVEKKEDGLKYCEALEDGNLLFFPSLSLKNFTQKTVTEFLGEYLFPYAKEWKIESSKNIFQKQLLIQLDISSKRPLHGARVLRFFANLHPTAQQWTTSSRFAELAEQYASKIPFPDSPRYDLKGRLERKFKQGLRKIGIPVSLPSPSDLFLIQLQKRLKMDAQFQETCAKQKWEFPSGSAWAVFTDQVGHEGFPDVFQQHFIVPRKALLCPEKSPVSLLERRSGKNLVDPEFLRELFSV